MRRIPEGWNDYISLNDVVEGTRFLPFKTPLVGSRFSPDVLMNRVDNLGFVLNLVKTTRYYKPEVLGKKQIQTMHFPLTGHGELPEEHHIKSIFDILLTYMSGAEDPKKLIGVHCTHGINRTGYIICRFMIDMLGVPPDKAIERFVRARGHRFVRPAYEEDLMRRSPSINTEAKKWHEIGGQVISAAVLNVTVDADMSEIQRHVNNNRQRDYTSRSRNQHQESTGSRHQDHEGTRSRNPDHERTRSRNPDHERTRSRDQERERSPANDADRSDWRYKYLGPRVVRQDVISHLHLADFLRITGPRRQTVLEEY